MDIQWISQIKLKWREHFKCKTFRESPPFLWFDNQAEVAANFYVSIFKNSKINKVICYGEAGPGPKGDVMIGYFEPDVQRFAALNGDTPKFTESISFMVNCNNQKEVDEYW